MKSRLFQPCFDRSFACFGCKCSLAAGMRAAPRTLSQRRSQTATNLRPRSASLLGTERYIASGDTRKSSFYATLSYCWGERGHFTTMKASIAARRSRILWTEIPKTFQDAVHVTRYLNIRYLWIDSFCIIQGDGEDWARESSKMADVHKNAHVTIAADSAKNNAEGFLVQSTYQGGDISTMAEKRAQKRQLAFVRHGGFHDKPDGCFAKDPLTQRAWAFQERHLSNRVLHFTTSCVLFECNAHLVAEGVQCEGRRNAVGAEVDTTLQSVSQLNIEWLGCFANSRGEN